MPATATRRRKRPGARLLKHDRSLGARFVAGADEAGRGCLAGPLVAAAVCFDTHLLTGARARPLAELNDSKQHSAERRERLYEAVLSCARPGVRGGRAGERDRPARPASLQPARAGTGAAWARPGSRRSVSPTGFGSPVDDFAHTAVVRGDGTSAAIAAASIIAKVTRDSFMQKHGQELPRVWVRVARRLHHPRAHPGGAHARHDPASPALLRSDGV